MHYDLAGVYSREGKVGAEAAIYEDLFAGNNNFPALREAFDQNRVMQVPKVSIAFGNTKEEGRKDNINMRNNWQEISMWYSPRTLQEVDIRLSKNNYRAVNLPEVIRSNKFSASYKAKVFTGVSVSVGGGIESLDKGKAHLPLVNFMVEGKIGDKFVSKLAFERGIIGDTITSLDRELYQQNFTADLSFEPLSRLSLGMGYAAKDYSDNNWTTGYDLWSSYILFSEPRFLKIFYTYDFKESKESATTLSPLTTGFLIDDHPYWAPKNYWSNSFGAYFKHILSEDFLGNGLRKYYTAEYSFGHDSDGYGFQAFKGGFVVELTSKLQVEALAELTSSPSYRKKDYMLTASYRW